eukprot:gene10883-3587_t
MNILDKNKPQLDKLKETLKSVKKEQLDDFFQVVTKVLEEEPELLTKNTELVIKELTDNMKISIPENPLLEFFTEHLKKLTTDEERSINIQISILFSLFTFELCQTPEFCSYIFQNSNYFKRISKTLSELREDLEYTNYTFKTIKLLSKYDRGVYQIKVYLLDNIVEILTKTEDVDICKNAGLTLKELFIHYDIRKYIKEHHNIGSILYALESHHIEEASFLSEFFMDLVTKDSNDESFSPVKNSSILLIFQFLDLESISNFRKTSKRYFDISKDDSIWLRFHPYLLDHYFKVEKFMPPKESKYFQLLEEKKNYFDVCSELMNHLNKYIQEKKETKIDIYLHGYYKSSYVGYDQIVKPEVELLDHFIHFETHQPTKLKCALVGNETVGKSKLKEALLKDRGDLNNNIIASFLKDDIYFHIDEYNEAKYKSRKTIKKMKLKGQSPITEKEGKVLAEVTGSVAYVEVSVIEEIGIKKCLEVAIRSHFVCSSSKNRKSNYGRKSKDLSSLFKKAKSARASTDLGSKDEVPEMKKSEKRKSKVLTFIEDKLRFK